MKANIFWRIAILIFVVGFSCGKKDDTGTNPGPVEENYIPYNVGNSWTYKVEPGNDTSDADTAHIMVIDRKQESGAEVAVVKEYSDQSPDDYNLTYFEQDGNHLYMHKIIDYNPGENPDSTMYVFDKPATWLKLPFVKDDTWQVFAFQGDPRDIPLIGSAINLDAIPGQSITVDMTLNGKVLGTENITAAGENFETYKVEFEYDADIQASINLHINNRFATFWISPFKGIIQIEFYDLNNQLIERRKLISYILQ